MLFLFYSGSATNFSYSSSLLIVNLNLYEL